MRKPVESTQRPARSRAPKRSSPAHDDIALRAYELFVARGMTAGREEEDWVHAERELLDDEARRVMAPRRR